MSKYIIEIGMSSHAGSYFVGPFKSEAIANVWFDNTFNEEGVDKEGTRIRYAYLSILNGQGVPSRSWRSFEGLVTLFG